MHEHVTLMRPDASSGDPRRISSALPRDLLEQVRGRVRLLALLVLAASAFDPLLFLVFWVVARVTGQQLPAEFYAGAPFRLAEVGTAAASAGLWWVARNRSVSLSRLYALGLAYEIVLCFTVAISNFWQFYQETGVIPP